MKALLPHWLLCINSEELKCVHAGSTLVDVMISKDQGEHIRLITAGSSTVEAACVPFRKWKERN